MPARTRRRSSEAGSPRQSAAHTGKSLLRVVAGSAGGTGLQLGRGARPMPSRMKQALFNILGDRIRETIVLDLFAGTGSLGIEALSRGAAAAVLVERDRGLCDVIKSNASRAGLLDRCRVIQADAYRLDLLEHGTGPFGAVFLDPPYVQSEDPSSMRKLGAVLGRLARSGMIEPHAVAALHVRACGNDPGNLPSALEATESRTYGTGLLIMCRLKAGTEIPGNSACNGTGRVV